MVKNYLKTLLLLTALFIAACAGKSAEPPISNQLAQEWNNLVRSENININSLRSIASKATDIGKWHIVWQSRLLQCQYESNPEEKRKACLQAQLAANIYPHNNAMQFDTYLVSYQQFSDSISLRLAKEHAATQLQHLKLILAQQQMPPEKQFALLQKDSLDFAQLLYLQGKVEKDISKLQKAYDIFKREKQEHKVADTLFLLAKIHDDNNQRQEALAFISECLLILENINSAAAYQHAKEWYDDRLLAR